MPRPPVPGADLADRTLREPLSPRDGVRAWSAPRRSGSGGVWVPEGPRCAGPRSLSREQPHDKESSPQPGHCKPAACLPATFIWDFGTVDRNLSPALLSEGGGRKSGGGNFSDPLQGVEQAGGFSPSWGPPILKRSSSRCSRSPGTHSSPDTVPQDYVNGRLTERC